MGSGHIYYCKKCKKEFHIDTGVGMMFPRVYESLAEQIRQGDYGKTWKKTMSSKPGIAVNAELRLYLCPICGHWEVDYDLSLYEPFDDAEDTSRKKSYVSPDGLISGWDIDYELIERYQHTCKKCSAVTVPVDDSYLIGVRLKCPDCGEPNAIKESVMWD